jgi:uncharacterized OsmC-like protein
MKPITQDFHWRTNMNTQAKEIDTNVINGIDTDHVMNLAGRISEDEDYGRFQFRANNRWVNGARSETGIQGFFAGGREDTSRKEPMIVAADQPAFLGGTNSAPNSVEHLLHALTSCLTTTLTYHASVQGISLGAIETSAVGDLNSRGFFGLSDDVRKGYQRIKVSMRVASQASVETLTALAMNSPVFEMVSRAVPVEFELVTS